MFLEILLRPLESPPPAFVTVESFPSAAHAAHGGTEIRRAIGETNSEIPDDVVHERDLREAAGGVLVAHHDVGDFIAERCKSKVADPILQPFGMPVNSRHCHQKRGSAVQVWSSFTIQTPWLPNITNQVAKHFQIMLPNLQRLRTRWGAQRFEPEQHGGPKWPPAL